MDWNAKDAAPNGIRPCSGSEKQQINAIINDAAIAYKGVIPDDRWHEPYMSLDDLEAEIAAGVRFTGYAINGRLVGVMGNDSAVAVARMVGGADLPSPEVAFVKSPRRAANLAATEQVIRAGPPSATAADRAVIAALTPALAQAAKTVTEPCDLSPLWQGKSAGCSNLVRGPFFAGGLTATDRPGVTRAGPWAETVSSTVRFSFTPYRWQKPVMVLVDQNSASSTELLAAMLQDAGKALVIGAPSQGSGCGWTMPRKDVTLANSGAMLLMPDCARFRKDGRNELGGIEPDVLVGFRTHDTPRQRVSRLLARLPAALNTILGVKR